MRYLLAIILLSAGPVWSQLHDAVKSAEIDKMFARATQPLPVLTKQNYAIEFRARNAATPAGQTDDDADQFWFVRRGSAVVSVAGKRYDVNAGDVVSVPRSTAYEIAPSAGRFEYVAVRVFPATRNLRIGIGAGPDPHPMPAVARKSDIDATLATADKNVTLHSAGAVLINHVVYPNGHGPWEVHQTCDDVYFLRLGTARAQVDGRLVNGKEDPAGEIRGTGVTGSREYRVEPGDMMIIPRNTVHFMDPQSGRLGYLLVKVCD
jgi:mannose-6-phosphate isomerase-like protein (cupin superfamily)